MKRFIISVFLVVVVQISYGQTIAQPDLTDSKELEASLFQSRLMQQSHTMKINVSDLSREAIGDLNNDITNYKGKITSVVYDENTRTMNITHNGLIAKNDFYQIITKHKIDKHAIISYQ